MSRITLTPSQTQFEASADETILEAALRQGYNLPNACQSGMCGTCIAQVVSGEVALGDYDDCALTDEDAAAGMVLLCACHAQSDVVLDLPAYEGAKAIAPRTMPARVAHIDVRGKMALLRLALPKSPPFKFYAGQYADILYKGTVRSYSLANAPSDNGVMEFHVRLREGGVFSPALFSGSLKVGDVLRVRAPLGAFTLHNNSHKPLIFIATGTPTPAAACTSTTARKPPMVCMTKPPCTSCCICCPMRVIRPCCPAPMTLGKAHAATLPNTFCTITPICRATKCTLAVQ